MRPDYEQMFGKAVRRLRVSLELTQSELAQRLSDAGMQIVTDYFKAILEGQPIHATIILDDKIRTRLELPCVVRRIIPDNARSRLRLEFMNLDIHQQQILGSYLMP